jgi:glycosyltransferase involved in cell wall biosynthesis
MVAAEKASVSVILPTHNRARYICRAVESVLNQTFADREVIVIDDGSTDNTRETLAPYKDRVRYYYQPNAGVSAARNAGVRQARSEWIAFLDSDDSWLPEKLSHQMQCVRDTGAEACFARTVPFNQGQISRGSTPNHRLFEDSLRLVLTHGLYVQSMLVKRDLFQRLGGFDESLRVAEDTRLVFNLAFAGPLAFVDEPLVLLERSRDRSGLINGSFDTDVRLCEAEIAILEDAAAWYRGDDPLVREELRSRLAHALTRRAQLTCAQRNYAAAKQFAQNALHYRFDHQTLLRSVAILVWPQMMGSRCRRMYGMV